MKLDLLIKKLILWVPKNIAGLIGLLQAIVRCIREIAMVITRLLCPILTFGADGKTDDRVMAQIAAIADKIDKSLEALKNTLLLAGE